MEQANYNTLDKKGKHLTYEERIKLESLYQAGLKPSEIGEQLGGRSRRTIERELKKGMYERTRSDLTTYMTYSADIGQQEHDMRATNKGPGLKIGKDHSLAKYLEENIGTKEGQFSPYAALANIKNEGLEFNTTICYKTVYNYIDKGVFLTLSNKDLLIKRAGIKRDYHKIRTAITNTKGTSISERPAHIDERKEYGHWEMDCVVGGQGTKTVLLVLSERMLRKELIFLMDSKTQENVIKILNDMEKELGSENFKATFKSITTDNGGEFLNFAGIEKSIFDETEKRTEMYYAHPFSSWERGTNENINKMIRRFIPKGTDIAKFTSEDIKRIEHWINNYPRKILGGLSANLAEQRLKAA